MVTIVVGNHDDMAEENHYHQAGGKPIRHLQHYTFNLGREDAREENPRPPKVNPARVRAQTRIKRILNVTDVVDLGTTRENVLVAHDQSLIRVLRTMCYVCRQHAEEMQTNYHSEGTS